ncbi:hypothetical protein Bca101_042118 [Brassica carinata]
MNDSCSFITVEAERNPESLRKDDDVRNSTFLVEGEEASLGSWLALYLQLVSYACLKDDEDDDSRQEQDVNQEAPTSDVPKQTPSNLHKSRGFSPSYVRLLRYFTRTDGSSGRDLVEEMIFKNECTVSIERKKNEPITVAAVRVIKDAAEIPLLATLSNYRRSEMCRVLMDELEKQMSEMRVCRLVFPALAEAVNTLSETWNV